MHCTRIGRAVGKQLQLYMHLTCVILTAAARFVLQVAVELLPDPALAKQVEQQEKERLQAAKASMSPQQIEAVIKETEELKLRQARAATC